jgi:HEAT repeat protein
MRFYDLDKEARQELVKKIENEVSADIKADKSDRIKIRAADMDTYIRKTVYLAIGKLYKNEKSLRKKILALLERLYESEDERIRQTMAYALGEIGKIDAESILGMLEKALHDEHHKVRNAVIGSLKQMGEKNPKPTLAFAEKAIHHNDPKVRREIVHGIELRGRKYPQDVLPLLKKVQHDKSKLVIDTIIHVIGQISYKKGCLEKVVAELRKWDNQELVRKALVEIVKVHESYAKFSAMTAVEAEDYIRENF